MTREGQPGTRSLLVAVVVWLAGLAVAVVYGHGFELQRMAASLPAVALAGVLVLPFLLRNRSAGLPVLAVVAVVAGYFGWRMFRSPVWDLARTDLLLLALGVLSLLVGMAVARSDRALLVLLGGLAVVLVANAVAVLIQLGDPTHVLFRRPRADQVGVSGLFYHRNYLAGLLELAVPVFLAVALADKRTWLRSSCLLLVVLGVALGYASHSRGGLLAIGIGCAVVLFMRLQGGWTSKSWNTRIAFSVGGLVLGAILVVAAISVVSRVSEQRGREGDLGTMMSKAGVRLTLAGAAYDQWQEAPLAGTGAGTFSYLVVRNWERGATDTSLGNPRMAHNDYLQTLAEYGIAGSACLVLLAGSVLALGVRGVLRDWGTARGLAVGAQLGALGAFCGAAIHSGLDYPLRILPNTLLFGLLVGVVLGGGARAVTPSRNPGAASAPAGVLALLLAVAAVIGAVVAGGREVAVLPDWFRFEQRLIAGRDGAEQRQRLREIIDRAPHYELARYQGRMVMRALPQAGEAGEALVQEGLAALDLALERHPFDGEARLVRANFRELAGDDEGAREDYLQGIAATWRREDKYGAMAGFSDHLGRRAEELFQSRQPGRALALFQRALEYRERSWELGFRAQGWQVYRPVHLGKVKILQERIDFLTGARVAPEPLDDIPPPPSR